ncbi:MAG: hypothetical protein ACOC8D_02450, partial [bacterium]
MDTAELMSRASRIAEMAELIDRLERERAATREKLEPDADAAARLDAALQELEHTLRTRLRGLESDLATASDGGV